MFSPHSRAPFRSHLRIPVRSLFQRSPSNASNKTYGIHSPKKACKSNSSTLLGQRLRGNPKWFTCNQSHKPWLPKVIMGSTSTTPEKFEFALFDIIYDMIFRLWPPHSKYFGGFCWLFFINPGAGEYSDPSPLCGAASGTGTGGACGLRCPGTAGFRVRVN